MNISELYALQPRASTSKQTFGDWRAEKQEWQQDRRYAIVVDAGSSGSRMQVYSWKDPAVEKARRETHFESTQVLPTVEKGTWDTSGHSDVPEEVDWQVKVEPGISSFATHPEDLDEYLAKLFKHAQAVVPASEVARTPVYLLATAGMRLVPDSQRDAIVARTCAYISKQTPFHVGSTLSECQEHVQVISGEQEGLLGWIAINYLMDGFHFNDLTTTTTTLADGDAKGKQVSQAEHKSTFGFLDMGGASTQIAFEPSDTALASTQGQAAEDDLRAVHLRMLDGTDVSSNVFVTTFLGFGTNEARNRYLTQLTHNTTVGMHALPHPSGDTGAAAIPDACLPVGLVQSGDKAEQTFVGTGSFKTCLSSLKPLLQKEASCSRPPCLFFGVHVPPIDFSVNHFIGVSEYWYSSNDIFHLGGVYDYVDFQEAAMQYCSRNWTDLKDEFDHGKYTKNVDEGRLRMQCFKSAWMATVLHEGIGIPTIMDKKGKGDGTDHTDQAQSIADNKNLFQSVNDIKGLSVSWTLGKAVLEASRGVPSVQGDLAGDVAGQVDTKRPGPGNWRHALPWDFKSSSPSGVLISAGLKPQAGSVLLVFGIALLALTLLACRVIDRSRASRASLGGRRRPSTPKSTMRALADLLPPPFGSLGGWFKRRGVASSRDYYVRANADDEMTELSGPVGGLFSNSDISSEEDGFYRTSIRSQRIPRSVGGGSNGRGGDGAAQAGVAATLLRAILPASWRTSLARTLLPSSPSSNELKRRKSGRSSGSISKKATASPHASLRREASYTSDHSVGTGLTMSMRPSRPGSPNLLQQVTTSGGNASPKAGVSATSSLGHSISRPSSRSSSVRGTSGLLGMTLSRPPSRVGSPASPAMTSISSSTAAGATHLAPSSAADPGFSRDDV